MAVCFRDLGLAVASLMFAQPSLAADSPNRLPQSSEWDIGKVEGICTTGASFGSGDSAVRIEVGKPPVGRSLILTTISTDPPKEWYATRISIAFDRLAPVVNLGFVKANEGRTQRIAEVRFKANEFAPFATAATMAINGPSKRIFLLALSKNVAALKSLDTCVEAQLAEWAVPTPMLTKVAIPAEMERRALVDNSDYPKSALHKGEQGTVGMLVEVDKRGRTATCRVVHSSKSEALDQKSCALVRARLRAEPARDAGGKPVEDWIYYALRWIMPTY